MKKINFKIVKISEVNIFFKFLGKKEKMKTTYH